MSAIVQVPVMTPFTRILAGFVLMEWAEELPTQCPPAEAVSPDNAAYYRYVDAIPLTEAGFQSHKKLFPSRAFKVGECIARSISVFSSLENVKGLTKLPGFRGKKLVEIVLPPESGLIMRTGKTENHYSWWRAKDFVPASHTLVEI